MILIRVLASILFQSFFISSFAQGENKDTAQCSKIIDEVSYYWKKDSLANNGFRFKTYKLLLSCKVDKVYKALLLDKLGKPNKIQQTNKGVEYIYYYYDSKAMPGEAASICRFIIFHFGVYDKYANSVTDEFGDY